jgi:hypothetical protein
MFKTNNFLGSTNDEHRRERIELPLTTTTNLEETLNFKNKKMCHQNELNM